VTNTFNDANSRSPPSSFAKTNVETAVGVPSITTLAVNVAGSTASAEKTAHTSAGIRQILSATTAAVAPASIECASTCRDAPTQSNATGRASEPTASRPVAADDGIEILREPTARPAISVARMGFVASPRSSRAIEASVPLSVERTRDRQRQLRQRHDAQHDARDRRHRRVERRGDQRQSEIAQIRVIRLDDRDAPAGPRVAISMDERGESGSREQHDEGGRRAAPARSPRSTCRRWKRR